MSTAINIVAGARFGHLTAIRKVGSNGADGRLWLCRCECGAEVTKAARVMQRAVKVGMRLRCNSCREQERLANRTALVLSDPRWSARPGHECDDQCKMRDRNNAPACLWAITFAYPDGLENQQIADILGLSKERVRQILAAAIAKMVPRAKLARLGE